MSALRSPKLWIALVLLVSAVALAAALVPAFQAALASLSVAVGGFVLLVILVLLVLGNVGS